VFALGGAVIALSLAGRIPAHVGPFDTTMAVRPSLSGETVVRLAPLGTIELDTHDAPLRLDLRVDELTLDEAERIAEDPALVDELGDDVADEVRRALVRLAIRCAVLAVAGGLAGALAARLTWRSAATGLVMGALLVGAVGGGTAATFNAEAVAEPRYTGLLTAAPTAVGDVESIVERFGEYRAQLSDLVANIVTLYQATEALPTFQPTDGTVRLLHVSDIHLNPQAYDIIGEVTEQFGVDAVLDTGDLTDWGTGTEELIVDQIGRLDVPYVWVRGNHDSLAIQEAVAAQPNAVVLDGEAAEVAGLRIWGIGDPRYTPDQSQADDGDAAEDSERRRIERFAPDAARSLAAAEPPAVDIALVHDPRAAALMGGEVPLVLAGHTHEASEDRIEDAQANGERNGDGDGGDSSATTEASERRPDTLLLTQGSTGGAGLRGLQGEAPEPLVASILYVDGDSRRLVAYDQVTVDGLGGTGATIERHILEDAAAGDETSSTTTGG
jgi:predicted phosphodiesterase